MKTRGNTYNDTRNRYRASLAATAMFIAATVTFLLGRFTDLITIFDYFERPNLACSIAITNSGDTGDSEQGMVVRLVPGEHPGPISNLLVQDLSVLPAGSRFWVYEVLVRNVGRRAARDLEVIVRSPRSGRLIFDEVWSPPIQEAVRGEMTGPLVGPEVLEESSERLHMVQEFLYYQEIVSLRFALVDTTGLPRLHGSEHIPEDMSGLVAIDVIEAQVYRRTCRRL